MNHLFNFESYKHLWKHKHPFPTINTAFTEPKPEGCVFILSNPIVNGKRRIYMALIDKVRTGEDKQFQVLLTGFFYILKKHPGNLIMPEKIGYLNENQKLNILNMTSNGIVLNENKTPLWKITSKVNKIDLFTNYQSTLKELENLDNVEIPFTQMTKPVNLHE